MATKHRIVCIRTANGQNTPESITHIGGKKANGNRWVLEISDAIKGIENGQWTFYVMVNGNPLRVTVAVNNNGIKYLCTITGNTSHLLALPDCPF